MYQALLYLLPDLILPIWDYEFNTIIAVGCIVLYKTFVLKFNSRVSNVMKLITFGYASCQLENVLIINGILNLSSQHNILVHLVCMIASKMHD